MQIDYDVLITYGGVSKKFDKGEYIFKEGMMPHFYYQIIEGEVRMYTVGMEDRELTQAVFNEGCSFGEPPLFLDKPYPSNAQATKPSIIMRLDKENFMQILDDFKEISRNMLHRFADRIYKKASSAQIWVNNTPEERIIVFLKNYMNSSDTVHKLLVPYTRQQIADYTGLRVETVIRTLKRMSQDGIVDIIDHKLYF